MSKTPSSVFNSKIRGNKKIELLPDDYDLISNVLALIWTKTEKKVETIYFEQDKVRLLLKDGARLYFDLQETKNEVMNWTIFIFLFFFYNFFGQFCPFFFFFFL
jgi:hypothetical protein